MTSKLAADSQTSPSDPQGRWTEHAREAVRATHGGDAPLCQRCLSRCLVRNVRRRVGSERRRAPGVERLGGQQSEPSRADTFTRAPSEVSGTPPQWLLVATTMCAEVPSAQQRGAHGAKAQGVMAMHPHARFTGLLVISSQDCVETAS